MKVSDAISLIQNIYIHETSKAAATAALELKQASGAKVVTTATSEIQDKAGLFTISSGNEFAFDDTKLSQLLNSKETFIFFQIKKDGSGKVVTSHKHFLYAYIKYILEVLADQDISSFAEGKIVTPSFHWQRTSYDYFLAQEGRVQRNLDREAYIREQARLGFTHIEVNGLAFPMGLEPGLKGETYPMFYTYCAALDQFVYSKLNKGIYPFYYLSANLANLKENARLAVKYGLTPGLTSFEPRSVPEQFFERYPMLRGARVDHPFRSFKPRYNMTITHPLVREHYAEMMSKLLKEIPELGYISIWTNDSGAGFEHTKSLYVGRNGGAYLIREWKDDGEIARLAGENALRFFHVLKDAAAEINPDFRVITRMESFYGEHDTIWQGLGDGIEIEAVSLISRGWEMPYTHPKYKDSTSITGGSVYQNYFDPREKPFVDELAQKDAYAHFYFTAGPHILFDPLLGVPYPKLTYQRLQVLQENGVKHLAHTGGGLPPDLVPYNINHEIMRLFQFNPGMNVKDETVKIAKTWAGEKYYKQLVKAWDLAEEAIFAYPNTVPLYSGYGFCWYRFWVRPLVPNMDAIPENEKGFYEDHICTTPHNPNNVDLSKDVLFELTTAEKSEIDLQRLDQNLWGPMDEAIETLQSVQLDAAKELGEKNVIFDQLVRLKALRCWFVTQRNVIAWIVGVHGYLKADSEADRKKYRNLVRELMEKEIANTMQVKELWNSGVEFMSVSEKGESPLLYSDNLPELMDKRIQLMKQHMDDEPYIDPDYIEKKAAQVFV